MSEIKETVVAAIPGAAVVDVKVVAPPPVLMIHRLADGLAILRKYAVDGRIDYVPNSYPNGTPKNPHTCYVCVEIGNEWVSEEDRATLIALKWRPEDLEQVWVLYY